MQKKKSSKHGARTRLRRSGSSALYIPLNQKMLMQKNIPGGMIMFHPRKKLLIYKWKPQNGDKIKISRDIPPEIMETPAFPRIPTGSHTAPSAVTYCTYCCTYVLKVSPRDTKNIPGGDDDVPSSEKTAVLTYLLLLCYYTYCCTYVRTEKQYLGTQQCNTRGG